ncbi:hypothetical protein QJS66_23500 (plasmid) [Kocuria rhizophila]|nr:hypothetical protein QJS66_23500 [Kocuria rhizophila]
MSHVNRLISANTLAHSSSWAGAVDPHERRRTRVPSGRSAPGTTHAATASPLRTARPGRIVLRDLMRDQQPAPRELLGQVGVLRGARGHRPPVPQGPGQREVDELAGEIAELNYVLAGSSWLPQRPPPRTWSGCCAAAGVPGSAVRGRRDGQDYEPKRSSCCRTGHA